MQNRESVLEVKSTPEEKKYIRNSVAWEYLGAPISRRLAWLAASLLSFGTVLPFSIKFVINLIDSIFDHDSFKEAMKNLGSAILFPLTAGLPASLSILPLPTAIPYSPSKSGAVLAKTLMLPIKPLYSLGKGKMKQEVGPRLTTQESSANIKMPVLGSVFSTLPSKRSYPEVRGINQNSFIDTVDIPASTPTSKYRLVFNASLEIYQFNFSKYQKENEAINCNTRTFNYPSLTKDDVFESMNDLVNAGIAEVYDLAKKMNWKNEEIEKNLHLFGYCFGGSIALQVAAYFKLRHQVNIPIFVDRSFSSINAVASKLIRDYTGLPEWYAKILCATYLFASGDLDIDSIAAVKKLDPNFVFYTNLDHSKIPTPPTTLAQKFKKFFGIGKSAKSADSIVLEGASLAESIDEAKLNCGWATRDIFSNLDAEQKHRFYADDQFVNGHFQSLDSLYVDKLPAVKSDRTAFEFYTKVIKNIVNQNEEDKSVLITRDQTPGISLTSVSS